MKAKTTLIRRPRKPSSKEAFLEAARHRAQAPPWSRVLSVPKKPAAAGAAGRCDRAPSGREHRSAST